MCTRSKTWCFGTGDFFNLVDDIHIYLQTLHEYGRNPCTRVILRIFPRVLSNLGGEGEFVVPNFPVATS